MSTVVLDKQSGKVRDSRDLTAAELILKYKRENKVWEAIELMLDAWAAHNPEEFQGFKVHLDETRETLFDKKFGTTKGAGKDQERRLTLIIPFDVQKMIRATFTPQELDMNREFFREFAKKFPAFVIPEKM